MKHQQIFRVWLSGVCVAVAALAMFSTGQAQNAVPSNNPGQLAVEKVQFEFRTRNSNRSSGASGLAGGQIDETSPGSVLPGTQNVPAGGNNPGGHSGGFFSRNATPKIKTSAAKFLEAVDAFKRAKDDETRKKTLAAVSVIVSQIFDEDLKRRESEVNDIRQRVGKLKALIDKRKESKDRIVELQLKIQLNEVEGLGFSVKQSARNRSVNPYYGGGVDQYYGGVVNSGMESMTGVQAVHLPMGRPGGSGGDDYGGGMSAESEDPRRKAKRTLRDVTKKLKLMKGEYDRDYAEKLLRPALEGYFAADLGGREREINGIQKRVDSLDKLIEQRRRARDQVISLQVEVLKNDADGLGFFSTSSSSDGIRISIPGGAATGTFGFKR
jgi:hypothetical protein